ncbi:hypothetical protein HF521_017035 [Silurus meridionalis]|uniref:Little elongation complex subunit 1 C-terminal domain-containing protein n=1 Tax=Silurus meridionalis TaxID=175797 RepID=A0A8T0BLL4_SILME|nr:hypothetical protein HF521_017035 [Silurus meridionalis]
MQRTGDAITHVTSQCAACLKAGTPRTNRDSFEKKHTSGMPWEVQLSVIYATHDLAPSNPEAALKTLES